ncbi:MAG: serine hydrolase [Bacteroidota bacterium]
MVKGQFILYRTAFTGLFLWCLSLLACQIKQPISEAETPAEVLQNVLDSIYQANPAALGIMAHVESPSQAISWSGAAGWNGASREIPLQADRPVLIASNTKTYVAAAVLRLIEQAAFSLESPIEDLISAPTREVLLEDDYQLDQIQVQHLLSHTSGIFDYVSAEVYFERITTDPGHRWSRDEQIALAISDGEPLGSAGDSFSYGDINYLLLTEIIEGVTGQPFYTAIRDLLDYEKNGLTTTWWESLEEPPSNTLPLAYQSITSMELDNEIVDHSFDLYGGGGIAATTKDLALFSQRLFNGQFFEQASTLEFIYTEVPTHDPEPPGYSLGLTWGVVNGLTAYGHGGFWGTTVNYFPDLDASISVFILERDERGLRPEVMEEFVDLLSAGKNLTSFPGRHWSRNEPEDVGVNPEILDDALSFLDRHCQEDGLDETMVIRNGQLIWSGDSINRVHGIYSCTKSFVSTMVGLLVEEGVIYLDQAVADLEPLLANHYPAATFRHFITMTSGYDAAGDNRWGEASADWSWTPYAAANPLFEPGTAYAYWDEAMILLGRALTSAAGESMQSYLNRHIAAPIGIKNFEWWAEEEVDGLPINFGGTGLKMSAEDQARFGWLYANSGRWEDQQLVPSSWVQAAMQNQVAPGLELAETDRKSTDGRGSYGFNWWVINPTEDQPISAAYTSGLRHNVCLVIPDWQMVIVRMGEDGNPEAGKHFVYTELLKRLAPGISQL